MKLQGQAENTPSCDRVAELMDLRQWLRARAEERRKLSTQAPFGYCAAARHIIHEPYINEVAEKLLKRHIVLCRNCDTSIPGTIIVAAEITDHARRCQPCRLRLANSGDLKAIGLEARGMMAFGDCDPIASVTRPAVTEGFRSVREIVAESGCPSVADFMADRNCGTRVGPFNLARFLTLTTKDAL